MTRITLDDAAACTLKDAVAQACARRETVVVTGPEGELARLVPVVVSSAPAGSQEWKGRPVRTAEQLARATSWREVPWGEAGSGQRLWSFSDGDDQGVLSLRLLEFG